MTEHKYAQLARQLAQEIREGVYASGQKLPSENQLAARTGYSRQTVRQAMSLLESQGLTVRRQGSGTYVRGAVRARPVSHNIAVVTTYIGEYVFPNILHGIDHVLAKNGYTSMLSATRNRVDNERQVLTSLRQKPIDGMIVEGTKTALPNPNIDLYDQFARDGIPVVFINGYYPDLKDPVAVVCDDRAGGRAATARLLKKGHTRIAGLFKSDDIQGHRRYAGYVQALQQAGLNVADDRVLWFTTESRNDLLNVRAMDVLAGCTAAVCYNDEVTLMVSQLLQSRGVRQPEEMELVSFDNTTIARLASPAFYSFGYPSEQLGRLAAEKLLALLDGQPVQSSVLPWQDG